MGRSQAKIPYKIVYLRVVFSYYMSASCNPMVSPMATAIRAS